MSKMETGLPRLGFVGVGTMGGPMARNLLKAGYAVQVYDLAPTQVALCVEAGAGAAESIAALVAESEVVLASLPSSKVFEEVAWKKLLPRARPGQIFIDLGTSKAKETRDLAAEFAEKGATLLDAPVSGGQAGAEAGRLRIFVGGDPEAAARCRPLLEVLGEPERVIYCGPSSSGQIVKGVNQLAMGLGAAAYLEALAFGVRGGVALEALVQAVGGDEPWRIHLARIAGRILEGRAEAADVKFPELPYFLEEARAQGVDLPLTETLFAFCEAGPRAWRDNMDRPTVSFWHRLMEGEE